VSQPAGIVAKIALPEGHYRRFVREEAQELLAAEAYRALADRSGDYYIFHYVKSEQALFAVFFLRYRPDSFLQHPLLAMLRSVERYADGSAAGYVVATADSLNWLPADFIYQGVWRDGYVERDLDADERKLLMRDLKKYFFKAVEQDFAVSYSRVLDRVIARRVDDLLEQARLETLRSKLPDATVTCPQEIFKGIFYNGDTVYGIAGSSVVVFENVDVRQLRAAPYGLCDDRHVLVSERYVCKQWDYSADDICLATDPARFRIHQKAETVYFTSPEGVFNCRLERYPDSDGRTFKLKKTCLGEDDRYIYFARVQVPKAEAGAYAVYENFGADASALLVSERQVRLGATRLDVDAPSFEVLTPDVRAFMDEAGLVNPTGLFGGCLIMHCRDRYGDMIVRNYDTHATPVVVERIDSMEDYLARARPLLREMDHMRRGRDIPGYDPGRLDEFYSEMTDWLSDGFDDKHANWQYNASWLDALNVYFRSCLGPHGDAPAGDGHLRQGVKVFDLVKGDCFAYPAIFHTMARIYVALRDRDNALACVGSAFWYGYGHIDLIWEDEDLRWLFDDPVFTAVREFREVQGDLFPVINQHILGKLDLITYALQKVTLLKRFVIPRELLTGRVVDLPADQRGTWESTAQAAAGIINEILTGAYPPDDKKYYYELYGDSPLITIRSHLAALEAYFLMAHSWYFRVSITECLPIARRIGAILAGAADDTTRLMAEEVRKHPMNRIFHLVPA